jgi:hypothetical protein
MLTIFRTVRLRSLLHHVWPFATLPGLILLFFNKTLLTNLILARGDTFLYFYPYWEAAAEALRSWRIPLWNPNLFMGVPFLANSQVGFLYPFNWLVWWLLPTTSAVKASILLHLFIAGWGTYVVGRRALNLGRSAALLASLLFALGGYLTAQVEHINQLQGLSWMPWFFAVLSSCGRDESKPKLIGRAATLFALLFALQMLAGHTQTTFITLMGLLIWTAAEFVAHRLTRDHAQALHFTFYHRRLLRRAPIALFLGAVFSLFLAAAQLFPTLELIQLSSRQGGLSADEVLSFSLHPLLLARSLLPHFGQSLFTEYVAFIPVTALILAILGAWQWRRWRGVLPAVALIVVALLLALGQFNPVNWIIARLPGFDLFRVPARWLVLYALAVSLLAGVGWQMVNDRWLVQSRPWSELPERARQNLWHVERPLRAAMAFILGLIMWGAIANILAVFIPTGPEAPYEPSKVPAVAVWVLELLLAYFLLTGQRFAITPGARFWLLSIRTRPRSPAPLLVVGLGVLYVASRDLPYNLLTTPEAYADLRPSLARLQAESTCQPGELSCPVAADRFLSLSDIFFDPGDQREIESVYADQLPAAALYDYIISVKQKEIITPNLPLAFGLFSVDGFDGGLLPLFSYSQLMQLILPAGVTTTDGRLREHLPAVPEAQWLDLFNARFLITDKVGDSWREGIFFDLQHPADMAGGENVEVGYVPPFEATELWLIANGQGNSIQVETEGGETWLLAPEPVSDDLYVASFPEAATPHTIVLLPCNRDANVPCEIKGLTLVDERDGTFHPLALGRYRLVHSGDVKIYDNLDVLPRAFMVYDWQWQSDVPASVAAMRHYRFDPKLTAVLIGEGGNISAGTDISPEAAIEITRYESEHVVIRTESRQDGLLLLTDTNYPGWQATIDGEQVTVHQADGIFRGVMVPAGSHLVEFAFVSRPFQLGLMVSAVGLLVWALLLGLTLRRDR